MPKTWNLTSYLKNPHSMIYMQSLFLGKDVSLVCLLSPRLPLAALFCILINVSTLCCFFVNGSVWIAKDVDGKWRYLFVYACMPSSSLVFLWCKLGWSMYMLWALCTYIQQQQHMTNALIYTFNAWHCSRVRVLHNGRTKIVHTTKWSAPASCNRYWRDW